MAALAAVVGLAFLGRMMSDEEQVYEEKDVIQTVTNKKEIIENEIRYPVNEKEISKKEFVHSQQYLESFKKEGQANKNSVEYLGDITDFGTRNIFGQPVYDLSSRENVSNKMNNLNPNPWTRVGPGLAVGPNVPSFGGKQQLFRVLPPNINEHRLTQLTGGITGPPKSVTSGLQSGQILQKHRPNKDISREPIKSSSIKTAPTLRPVLVKTGTFTKKDQNILSGGELARGAPRYNRGMGYLTNPQNKLERCDRRSKPDRTGNPGRMNVRADPLGSFGMVTTVRIDDNKPGLPPPKSFVPMNYVREGIQEVNPFKDAPNPYASYLDTAKKVLEGNPYVPK